MASCTLLAVYHTLLAFFAFHGRGGALLLNATVCPPVKSSAGLLGSFCIVHLSGRHTTPLHKSTVYCRTHLANGLGALLLGVYSPLWTTVYSSEHAAATASTQQLWQHLLPVTKYTVLAATREYVI